MFSPFSISERDNSPLSSSSFSRKSSHSAGVVRETTEINASCSGVPPPLRISARKSATASRRVISGCILPSPVRSHISSTWNLLQISDTVRLLGTLFFLDERILMCYCLYRKEGEDMSTFAERLSAVIVDSKLTKTKFAEAVGISQPFLSQICSGVIAQQ